MTIDFQALRLDGVYRMNDRDELMLRVKLAGGELTAAQAIAVAGLAERLAGGKLHATCRGSLELHRLTPANLPEALAALAAAGLTSRGACGGAVRGVSCSASAPAARELATRIQRHFTDNPEYETLPKKFKIGVDAGYDGSRHLIQDAGLVAVGLADDGPRWDLWAGGGLGRQPRAALLLARAVPEALVLPLLEALLALYGAGVEKGQRLKVLVAALGADEFRRQVAQAVPAAFDQPAPTLRPLPADETESLLTVPLFGGELEAALLWQLATLAETHDDGRLRITADQQLLLFPRDAADCNALAIRLAAILAEQAGVPAACRICPGSHECRMGLSPTRDLMRNLLAELGDAALPFRWAISGCPNSCSQPQLADLGIVTSRRLPGGIGERWRFSLYRRQGQELARPLAEELSWGELVAAVRQLVAPANGQYDDGI